MIICEVLQSGTRYVFESRYTLTKGAYVLCETRYGKNPGVVANCFEVEDTESPLFKRYLELMGASEPLKSVIGAYVPFDMVVRFFETCKGKNNG